MNRSVATWLLAVVAAALVAGWALREPADALGPQSVQASGQEGQAGDAQTGDLQAGVAAARSDVSSPADRVAVPLGPLARSASYSFPAERRALRVSVFRGDGLVQSGAKVSVRSAIDAAHVAIAVDGAAGDRVEHHSGVTDDRGDVLFAELPLGVYRVTASNDDGRVVSRTVLLSRAAASASADGFSGALQVVLTCSQLAKVACTVYVMDGTRRELAGARIFSVGDRGEEQPAAFELLGTTDARGQLRTTVAPGLFVAKAETDQGEGIAYALVSENERQDARVVIRVVPVGSLLCQLPPGYDGAEVVAALAVGNGSVRNRDIAEGPVRHRRRVESETVRFRDLPVGRYVLRLRDVPEAAFLVAAPSHGSENMWPGSVRKRSDPSWPPRALVATVRAGATTTVELAVAPGLQIRGRVLWAADRSPVAGAQLMCRPVANGPEPGRIRVEPRAPKGLFATGTFHGSTVTDADGCYQFERLRPGLYEVAVTGSDCSRSHAWVTVPATGASPEPLQHLVGPAGMLVGQSPVGVDLRLVPAASGDAYTWRARGSFAVPGLPPGEYSLEVVDPRTRPGVHPLVKRSRPAASPPLIVPITIRAGEATLCRLADHLHAIVGVVRWRGEAAADAVVHLGGEVVRAAADGAFSLATVRTGPQKLWVDWDGVAQSFDVTPDGGLATIELPPTELLVSVEGSGGELADCTLTVTSSAIRWKSRRLRGAPCLLRGLPVGDYLLTVTTAAGDHVTTTVHVVASHTATLRIPQCEPLTVFVRNAAGVPVRSADVLLRIQAESPHETPYPGQAESTGVHGTARFRRVPVGPVEVVITYRGKQVASTIEVTAGMEASLDVELP